MGETEQELLKTGLAVGFRMVDTVVEPSLDRETFAVTATLELGEDDAEDPSDLVEWAAFGFIFVLASLSFADARPRGYSEHDFEAGDQFCVSDLIAGLAFKRGELHYDADYVRGRCMKTTIEISASGMVTVCTRARGKQILHWIDRLKGKKQLQIVGGAG